MNARVFVGAIMMGLVFTAAACGGDRKGARSPDDVAETSSAGAKEDMPASPDGTAAPSSTPSTTDTHTGAAGGMLAIAPMKLTAANPGKDDKPVELLADGSVVVGGKTVAKIKGDEIASTGGTSMVTVGVTGALVGNGVKSGLKFEGDEVTGEDGSHLSVADDGTITSTKDGKADPVGKVEGGTTAKRTALVLAVLWLPPPGAPAAAPKGKPDSKTTKKK
jgi:hypothetical protein